MAASYRDRLDRLDRLEGALPASGDGLDCRTLLTRMSSTYSAASQSARVRAIQRDLEELISEGRAESVNPGGKPLRYRQTNDGTDRYVQDFAWRQIQAAIEDLVPEGEVAQVMRLISAKGASVGLGEDRVQILTDHQPLIPAALKVGVLGAVLQALVCSCAIEARYRDAQGKTSSPVLHPQAIVQRGPRIYLYALKDEEREVRMYALHRFTRASVSQTPARPAAGFSLQAAARSGFADFSDGERLELVLLVRGYVAQLLHDCALSDDQSLVDEPEGSAFDYRLSATVMHSGNLLRWILGCGDNLVVVEPISLRAVVAAQHAKAAGLYGVTDIKE